MSLIDGIRTKFNVGGVNPFTPGRTAGISATSGSGTEAASGSVKRGWEAYHSGENPNGLKGGFLADGTGEGGVHRLNMYM